MSEAGTTASTSQPIAFRSDEGDIGSSLIHVLLITALLLGAVLGALVFAKRRGWLQRWTGTPVPGAMPAAGAGALKVEQRLRLSARTTLYRVADGDRRYVVVESIGGVHLAVESAAEHRDHG